MLFFFFFWSASWIVCKTKNKCIYQKLNQSSFYNVLDPSSCFPSSHQNHSCEQPGLLCVLHSNHSVGTSKGMGPLSYWDGGMRVLKLLNRTGCVGWLAQVWSLSITSLPCELPRLESVSTYCVLVQKQPLKSRLSMWSWTSVALYLANVCLDRVWIYVKIDYNSNAVFFFIMFSYLCLKFTIILSQYLKQTCGQMFLGRIQ